MHTFLIFTNVLDKDLICLNTKIQESMHLGMENIGNFLKPFLYGIDTCFVLTMTDLARNYLVLQPPSFRCNDVCLNVIKIAPSILFLFYFSDSCRLSHRHWEVTDGNGKTEVVDGEGVVGR